MIAEIITLRAIALKPQGNLAAYGVVSGRDHNATSYSTETDWLITSKELLWLAEIITLRAIALKQLGAILTAHKKASRDHNATSYSTETPNFL